MKSHQIIDKKGEIRDLFEFFGVLNFICTIFPEMDGFSSFLSIFIDEIHYCFFFFDVSLITNILKKY